MTIRPGEREREASRRRLSAFFSLTLSARFLLSAEEEEEERGESVDVGVVADARVPAEMRVLPSPSPAHGERSQKG